MVSGHVRRWRLDGVEYIPSVDANWQPEQADAASWQCAGDDLSWSKLRGRAEAAPGFADVPAAAPEQTRLEDLDSQPLWVELV
jgi:hypothetical protein